MFFQLGIASPQPLPLMGDGNPSTLFLLGTTSKMSFSSCRGGTFLVAANMVSAKVSGISSCFVSNSHFRIRLHYLHNRHATQ